ncbi:TPA: hypothetical protein ACVU5U_004555, partial [Vibrio parahaemolyticus]
FWYAVISVLKCNAVTSVLRASPLKWALVCKRKNVAISQDLAVKAHVVSAFNFSVNQRGKNPKLASFQRLICFLVL